MHQFEQYYGASSTSEPPESIENRTLPRIPQEGAAKVPLRRDKNIISGIESTKISPITNQPTLSNITPYSFEPTTNVYSTQRKVSSMTKPYYRKPFHNLSTTCYSLLDEQNLPYTKRGKPLTINDCKTTKHTRRRSRSYDKLGTSNDAKVCMDVRTTEFVHLPKLESVELKFLQLVFEDDVSAVEQYLEEHPSFNINCIDFQGVSALHIAVQNKSEAMVELLLSYPNLEIGDSVLHAIRNNSIKILVILLEAQCQISPGLEFAGTTHSNDFPVHVTPLILAAQLGRYEIVMLLIDRGHTINRPHLPNCVCRPCRDSLMNDDVLHVSIARLSVYQAISSPAYLVHVSSDPILAAFFLTAELAANAVAYRHLAAAYLQLADDVSAFAVDLIGCCRTSEEVEFILKQINGCTCRRHFVLPRLLMALDYKQKEFVAHPNTQQVLESYWIGDWYEWRNKSLLSRASTFLRRIFMTPIILIVCMIAPRHRFVSHWKIPLNKLITHVAAYFVFLGLVFYISNQDKSAQKRGPPNTGAEGPLILFICGYTWSCIRMCLVQGPRRYFTKIWNWAEILMIILFGITFAFWVASAVDIATNDKETIERKYWHPHDPTLLAEGTFCLASIFAFIRLMFLCQLNYQLGPLQVSLGKMTIDIYQYIIVFAIIMCAFAAGLARFYQYYDGMVHEDEYGMKTVQVSSFTSLSDTLNTLFWALFCMAPLESADVVLENTRAVKQANDKLHNAANYRHGYTERIGYFCFGCFEVISVIVVLNMLIATMSNTFQRVTDNVDIEWTFGKSEVYIDYMMQTTLPSPLNLIPTAAGMSSVIEWILIKINRPPGAYAKWALPYCCYIERDLEANIQREYPALMSVILQRYFRNKNCTRIYSNNETEMISARRYLDRVKKMVDKWQQFYDNLGYDGNPTRDTQVP